jgi:beta-fructofuranosidase
MMSRRNFLSGIGAATAAVRLPRLAESQATMSRSLRIARDPMRPQFHLLPAANWMNDPNGPVYWNGKYHMFYQYNPNGAFWGDMHWGHACSTDMVHWRHLPIALSPTPGGPDAQGCFTGTAVVDDGHVTVIYTGVVSAPESEATSRNGVNSLRETQCLATSADPDLKVWTKRAAPLIPLPPALLAVNGFRDPSPWRQKDAWFMAVGSGTSSQGGLVLLYRSDNLLQWNYQHVVASGEGIGREKGKSGMWECPDFFPLGGKHVLIYSSEGKSHWQSGNLDMKQMLFQVERAGTLDYGAFYAGKTQLDKSGNRILWGWILESRPLEEYRAAGWAGVMSLPRILTLSPEGQVRTQVASAVRQLRGQHQSVDISADDQQNQRQIADVFIADCCGGIVCTIKRSAEPVGLSLVGDIQGGAEPWLTLRYDPVRPDIVSIDGRDIPLDSSMNDELSFHLYIDGSVIEAFVNEQIAYTKRFYYSGLMSPKTKVHILGKSTNLSSMSMWQLSPISKDRLTT